MSPSVARYIPSTQQMPHVARPVDPSPEFAACGLTGTVASLGRDEILFFEGDTADYYYRIVTGAVRTCTLLADGRRHIGDFFLPGDFIGLGEGERHLVGAEAVTDTTLVRYARRSVDTLVEERPRLSRWMLAQACNGLAAAQHQKLLLGRKTAQERIASFLLAMADREGAGGHIRLPMTRADIGDYLGLTTETVSRTFSHLKGDAVIVLDGINELRILDRDVLEELAGEL